MFVSFIPWLDFKSLDYGNLFYIIACGSLLAAICLYRGHIKKSKENDLEYLDNETYSYNLYKTAYTRLSKSTSKERQFTDYSFQDMVDNEFDKELISQSLFEKYYFGI